ncbi:efflux RND transporter periplasmic adaptor subunit [Desulfosporosinus sp. Sb-LF]|uniref:efflux RND transporter periplasmic adaptor subunit n=1 Tax=Desulfosporosinus sp. Sb-LF TaxID=2560027 RepID=UPI00107F1DBD|nr:efflux RND transporter periplasmic adaptor subunit [Desulfosporosinus sp. Sb-LF]TGE33867.1 efflux RND transporter periplasmic adaptor subunit [Desulfosporosinus sp. Sb-LF]
MLLINIVGCNKSTATSQPTQANANGQGQAQSVSVIKVNKSALTNTISVVGKILPSEEITVSPKSAGRVESVQKDVGQEVSAGEVLMALESSDSALQIEKTRILLDDAKRNSDQKKTLLDSGAISKSEFDTALNTYNTYLLTMQQNENDLANAQVRSPINGIVTAKNVGLGETVSSSTAAYTIVNIDKVLVNASLMEDEVNYVKVGQAVDIVVPAISNQTYKGIVAKISPYASDKDKTYPMWVEVDNQKRVLKPGMFAEIKLKYNRLEAVISVPKAAIVDKGDKKVVYVVNVDKAAERPVKTGIDLNGMVEITEGLNSGDILITSGLQTLKDGKSVSIKAEGK